MRRRAGAVAVAALSIAAPLSALTLPTSAAAQPADVPRTPFELNGGSAWTTLEEEQAFLAEVDALSDRVSITEIARTPQGRPLQLVQIGAEERSVEEVAEAPSALTACLQHGNEPAGREACLQLLRDVAFDDSRETERLLERGTLLVIPTVNPDGRARNTRGNAAGVDINRDHLALETVEAQALARVLRDYDVDMVNDAHEYGPARTGYDYDLLYLWPRNLNVDDHVYRLSRELNLDYTVPSAQAAGYTASEYGIVTTHPPRQIAGDQDERIFRNMAGLRHVTGMLTETLTSAKNDAERADRAVNQNRRVDTHLAAMSGTLEFFGDNAALLEAQSKAAEHRAISEGRDGIGEVYFAGADNDVPEAGEAVPAPCSYTLTQEQYESVAQTLELHEIAVTAVDGGVSVSMAQAAKTRIPLLLDDRARFELVDGTPVACG
jgi:hypothetical protein